ncbi:hypothetical protein [Arcticibacterium luteifluviistationis]|uniref:Uncharacterized protein n=1 Tax=Arcticibacterium luteifluviistationis TaxID=1784714 RepID=A0A2Z4G801_9BACT|nr:hypothetical protein [Arcticibacterium luteifluviistationis]AWV97302.1 hypothetical protein DJ013_03600 [Arcticibacterium luteifluviistationis]
MHFKKAFIKLFVFSLILVSKITFAHQPDLSNIIISKTDNGQVILQINSSLTAFQQEVNFIHGEGAYKTPEEFQEMVINHFRNSFSFIVNGNDTLQVKNPQVFLGHETKLIAEIIGLPEDISAINFKAELFKDIHNNQSIVIFLLDGFPTEKYGLADDNSHQINIKLEEGYWHDSKTENAGFNLKYLLYLLIPLVAGLLFYFIKNRKTTKPL